MISAKWGKKSVEKDMQYWERKLTFEKGGEERPQRDGGFGWRHKRAGRGNVRARAFQAEDQQVQGPGRRGADVFRALPGGHDRGVE